MVSASKITNSISYLIGAIWLVRQVITSVRKTPLGEKSIRSATGRTAAYATFDSDMRYLIGVCFPAKGSKESLILGSFAFVLLARTLVSLAVADVDGYLVKQLINKDRPMILRGMLLWFALGIPSSFINALIKYLQARLALAIRSRLTAHVRDLYFTSDTYFKISHLDKRVANPEHAMTEDIAQWGDRFADLLSSLGKPLVDVVFFSSVLFKTLGFANQFAASVVVWESGKLLKWIRPDYARIVQQRGSLEADLRLHHTRVIAASEEIAFCKGDTREKMILEKSFRQIYDFTLKFLRQQVAYHTIEDFVTKYLWTAVGTVQVGHSLLKSGTNAGDNAKYLITLRRMMVRNGDATERLLVGIKDVHEFSGYTRQVMDMIRVFKDQQKPVAGEHSHIEVSEDIQVTDLPIITPTGDLLIEKMSLRINAGDRVLILGPNGCGKSSLFRILCGLWPMRGGAIAKPASHADLFFLPQRPYLLTGTFRDQIIYPHTVSEMHARGITDADLLNYLSMVLMTSVCETHGGLDAVKEWSEVLSGGEKQRLGISRVIYHRPKFAILDECSSAINVEAEQEIFSSLINLGMGLITISHRHTLFKFHTKVLTFDGCGNYNFNNQLQATHLQGLTDRKYALMGQLHEVCRDLGEDWPRTHTGPPVDPELQTTGKAATNGQR